MSETKYLVDNWQGFIQQIVYYVSREYTEFCLVEYPMQKEDKFEKIDEKLIQKYRANRTKDQLRYNKQKGNANFKFLRYKNTAIIMKTKGKIEEKITCDDVFHSIEKKDIVIKVTNLTSFKIKKGGKDSITVFMTEDFYKYTKAHCLNLLDTRMIKECVAEFNKLNGIPAWQGINEQRGTIKKSIINRAKKSKVKLDPAVLRIYTKRHPVKVFK